MLLFPLPLLVAALGLSAAPAPSTADDWCEENRWHSDDQATACEVREIVTSADRLDLAATNGSVTVTQWDRADVLVRARVQAAAPGRAEAEQLVAGTAIVVDGGHVRDTPPTTGRGRWVGVSYQVFAPAGTDLDVAALNGPVAIEGLRSTIRARSTNGPVRLAGLAGDVRVVATNGPVDVRVDGPRWDGAGLDVTATNGPISVALPAAYSARLSATTATARISADGLRLPARDRRRGEWTGDAVETTLGGGGPALTLRANNGPVRLTVTD